MAAHLQGENRKREDEPDPEPARHIREFGVRRGVRRDEDRLQGHATDRARSRADLADLGVHRAGVDRALGNLLRFGLLSVRVLGRVCHELRLAPGRAEIVGPTSVLHAVLRGVRVDHHPAYGVLHKVRARCGRLISASRMFPVAVADSVVMVVQMRPAIILRLVVSVMVMPGMPMGVFGLSHSVAPSSTSATVCAFPSLEGQSPGDGLVRRSRTCARPTRREPAARPPSGPSPDRTRAASAASARERGRRASRGYEPRRMKDG